MQSTTRPFLFRIVPRRARAFTRFKQPSLLLIETIILKTKEIPYEVLMQPKTTKN